MSKAMVVGRAPGLDKVPEMLHPLARVIAAKLQSPTDLSHCRQDGSALIAEVLATSLVSAVAEKVCPGLSAELKDAEDLFSVELPSKIMDALQEICKNAEMFKLEKLEEDDGVAWLRHCPKVAFDTVSAGSNDRGCSRDVSHEVAFDAVRAGSNDRGCSRDVSHEVAFDAVRAGSNDRGCSRDGIAFDAARAGSNERNVAHRDDPWTSLIGLWGGCTAWRPQGRQSANPVPSCVAGNRNFRGNPIRKPGQEIVRGRLKTFLASGYGFIACDEEFGITENVFARGTHFTDVPPEGKSNAVVEFELVRSKGEPRAHNIRVLSVPAPEKESPQHDFFALDPDLTGNGVTHGSVIRGRIRVWMPDKGFGFIANEPPLGEVFVHNKAFKGKLPEARLGSLDEAARGEEIEFRLDLRNETGPKARCATIVGDALPPDEHTPSPGSHGGNHGSVVASPSLVGRYRELADALAQALRNSDGLVWKRTDGFCFLGEILCSPHVKSIAKTFTKGAALGPDGDIPDPLLAVIREISEATASIKIGYHLEVWDTWVKLVPTEEIVDAHSAANASQADDTEAVDHPPTIEETEARTGSLDEATRGEEFEFRQDLRNETGPKAQCATIVGDALPPDEHTPSPGRHGGNHGSAVASPSLVGRYRELADALAQALRNSDDLVWKRTDGFCFLGEIICSPHVKSIAKTFTKGAALVANRDIPDPLLAVIREISRATASMKIGYHLDVWDMWVKLVPTEDILETHSAANASQADETEAVDHPPTEDILDTHSAANASQADETEAVDRPPTIDEETEAVDHPPTVEEIQRCYRHLPHDAPSSIREYLASWIRRHQSGSCLL